MTLAGSGQPDILRFLNVRSATSPSLSPDGKQFSFRSTITGQPQLWVVNSSSGWPKQLTFGESVTFHQWSPTGEWIIYGTDRGGNEQEGYYLIRPDGNLEIELLPPSDKFRVFGGFTRDGRRIAYSQSSSGNNPVFDIYLLDIESRESTCVFVGRPGLYVRSWRPDGQAVILTEAVGENAVNVYLLDIPSKQLTTVFKPSDPANYESFSWNRNGSGFYLATNQDREFLNLAYYDVNSKQLNFLEDLEFDITSVKLTNDGALLAWISNERGYSQLRCARITPSNPGDVSAHLTIPDLPQGVYELQWATRSHTAAIRIQNPQLSGDIWTWNAEENNLHRATYSTTAGLDMTKMVVPTHHSFKARDGVTIHGLLYLPAQTDDKPPILLNVHGGPTAQALPTFKPELQFLLTRGIAVFDLNYRGSTGYGKTFARLNDRRLKAKEYLDMEDALDWLGKSELVDAERAAVMGLSYGGYLSMAAVTRLPDRFDAGVASVGVSNWISALEGASPQLKASDRYEYGNIDDPVDREFFRQISPITYVDNVVSPVMIIHGANDPRDPPTESDQFVSAIRKNGGNVEYLRFPDEGHLIRKLSNQIIAYRQIAVFLERHLKLRSK